MVFLKNTGVEIGKRDVQAFHSLREKETNIVNFVYKKDCLQSFPVKDFLLDPTKLDFPQKIKIFVKLKLCVLII